MKLSSRILAALGILCATAACQKFSFEFTDSDIIDGELRIHVGEYHRIGTDTDLDCVWTSSDESIAKVNDGRVYGVSTGECTISAECNRCTRSVNVRVKATEVLGFKMPATLQVVPGYSSTFEVSDFDPTYANAGMLSWNFASTYPYNDHFSFSVSGNSVYVSADKTTPKDAQALLIAHGSHRVHDDGSVEDCEEAIKISITDISVNLDAYSLKLEVGDTHQLTYHISPASASPTVSWSSSAPSVASCDNGLVTALAEGSATVTLSVDGKAAATCSVSVLKKRVLGTGYKICLYGKCEQLSNYPYDKLTNPISSIDVIPGGFSRSVYIGAEDGYTIPSSELERISGEGKRYYSISATGLHPNWFTDYKQGITSDNFYVWMEARLGQTGTVNITAPNGSKATLSVRGRIGSVSVGNEMYDRIDGTIPSSGGTVTLHRPKRESWGYESPKYLFYLNVGGTYDEQTSYEVNVNDPYHFIMTFPSEFSNKDFNSVGFTPDTPLKTYEFHILDGPTGGKEIDYIVKINLVD